MSEPIRVLLCDDHRVVRAGLRRLLEEHGDLSVVGEAGTAAEVQRLTVTTRPDVVVLDIGLPDRSGLDVVGELLTAAPATRVLILSMHEDIAYLRRAFDVGAIGYLPKDAADVELVAAVREAAAGRRYVHPSLGAALLAAPTAEGTMVRGPGGRLTDRETAVLRLLALGHTNAEMGQGLFLSERTIETHRAHIRHKLGVSGQAELVRIAREAGLLDEHPDLP